MLTYVSIVSVYAHPLALGVSPSDTIIQLQDVSTFLSQTPHHCDVTLMNPSYYGCRLGTQEPPLVRVPQQYVLFPIKVRFPDFK